MAAGLLSVGVASAGVPPGGLSLSSEAQLVPSGFGEALQSETVANGYVFAAAPFATGPAGVQQGAVFVFAPTDAAPGAALQEVAELTPGAGIDVTGFGSALAVSPDGQEVFVAADDSSPQEVFAFTMPAAGWVGPLTPSATLVAPSAAAGSQLGFSLALDGDTVVAGAPGASAAYVFQRPAGGWVGTISDAATLTSTDPTSIDGFATSFGWGVQVSGDTVLVGDSAGISPGGQPGVAYVFQRPAAGWQDMTESARLVAAGGTLIDAPFPGGHSSWLALSGDTVAIPATVSGPSSLSPEELLVYTRPPSGWAGTLTQNATLTAPGVTRFGSPIIDSNTVYAPGGSGEQVFLMPAGGWSGSITPTATLTASDGADLPGPINVSGDEVLAGGTLDGSLAAATQTSLLFTEPAGGWSGDLHETATLAVAPPTVQYPPPAAFVKPAAGWTTESPSALLTPSGTTQLPSFGSVAASGSTVVATPEQTVGRPQGPAYVFSEGTTGWQNSIETTTLSDSGGAVLGPTAVSGSTIVAPAGMHLDLFSEPARGWSSAGQQTATLHDSGTGALLGAAISGDTIVSGRDVFVEPSGGWTGSGTQVARLQAPAAITSGCGQAISGATIALDCGIWVRVYTRPDGGWHGVIRPAATLLPPDGRQFTESVAVSGRDVAALTGSDAQPGGSAAIFVEPRRGWKGLRPPTAVVHVLYSGGFHLSAQLALDHGVVATATVGSDHYGSVGDEVAVDPPPARGWGHGSAPAPIDAAAGGNVVALAGAHVFISSEAIDVSTLTGSDPPITSPALITGSPRHRSLMLTISHGTRAPRIHAVTITPPAGLSLPRDLHSITLSGTRRAIFSARHGRLSITLPLLAKQVTISIPVTGAPRRNATRPQTQLTVTDAAGQSTMLRAVTRRRGH
jgi:hypothetical protein